MPKVKKNKPICPVCGRPIDWIERARKGNQVYLYAVHYLGYEKTPKGKIKKKVEKCYLGPERAYIYVTKTHLRDGLVLRGAHDRERLLEYLEAIIRGLNRAALDVSPEFLRDLAERLRSLADTLEHLAGEIEKAERAEAERERELE